VRATTELPEEVKARAVKNAAGTSLVTLLPWARKFGLKT